MKVVLIINIVSLIITLVGLTVFLIKYFKVDKTLFHTTAELAIVKDEKKNKLEAKLNTYTKPNLADIYPEVYNIIAAWCKEVGIYQVAIKTNYDSKSDCYKLTLYTERPGYFIGKAGSLIEKYKKMLQECRVGRMIGQIEIEEISGIVNQNQVDVEDYYSSYMAIQFVYEVGYLDCELKRGYSKFDKIVEKVLEYLDNDSERNTLKKADKIFERN